MSELMNVLMPRDASVLRLFGVPHLTVAGRRTEIPDGSRRLVAFAALHPGGVDRRLAAGALWPDGDEDRAAGNLRSALWRLGRAGTRLIRVEDGLLRLAAGLLVDADLAGSWATRMIEGRPEPGDLTVPQGPAVELLPGWYDDWALLERERIRQRMLHGFEALSRELVQAGRWAEAVEAALVAVAVDPLRETAQRRLIEAHLAEGNWAEAFRAYQGFRWLLHRELGVEPGPGLGALLAARQSVSSGSADLSCSTEPRWPGGEAGIAIRAGASIRALSWADGATPSSVRIRSTTHR
jgi:DNA-binding SARP family transcriptional activator